MIPLRQILDEANTSYIRDVDAAKLGATLSKLEEMLKSGELTESNQENAEALYARLGGKYMLTKFVQKPTDAARAGVHADLDRLSGVAQKKGYAKTVAVLNEISDIFCIVEKDLADVLSLEKAIASGANDVESLKAVISAADEAEKKLELEVFPKKLTGDAVLPDIKALVKARLNALRKTVGRELGDSLAASLGKYVKDITDKYSVYEFYPSQEYDEGGKANAVILSSPFVDDVLLYASHNRKDRTKKLLLVDAMDLDGDIAQGVFDYFKSADADAVLLNAAQTEQEFKEKLLELCIRYGTQGHKVTVSDSIGDGILYSEALKVAKNSGFSVIDVSSEFLSLPPYGQVADELIDREMLTREQSSMLKSMPFLGFMGLNQIVVAYASGANWLEKGKRISEKNRSAALSFLRHIKAPYMFIDAGWGDFSQYEKQFADDEEFDYDKIKGVSAENIRRIVEYKCPIFAKCGMVTRYCTVAGEDKQVWASLTRDEMESRLTAATKSVFMMLKVPIDPEVELLDELDNPTAGGLCVDGGKVIRYKLSCAKSLEWTQGAVVHESFHAMQSKLTQQGGWSRWYYDELGITQGRVDQWKEARKIYDHNTKSDIYTVHIYECDARAFEKDCKIGSDYYWNEIELD